MTTDRPAFESYVQESEIHAIRVGQSQAEYNQQIERIREEYGSLSAPPAMLALNAAMDKLRRSRSSHVATLRAAFDAAVKESIAAQEPAQ